LFLLAAVRDTAGFQDAAKVERFKMTDFDSAPIEQRLVNGARIMGTFWRAGDRCISGWAIDCHELESSRSRICKAKLQWVELALTVGREILDEKYGVVLAMTNDEFEAAGLTVVLEIPERGTLRLGPKGGMTARQYLDLAEHPDGLAAVMRVLGAFPGSKMVGKELEAPAAAP
jgi:hypothetical protein